MDKNPTPGAAPAGQPPVPPVDPNNPTPPADPGQPPANPTDPPADPNDPPADPPADTEEGLDTPQAFWTDVADEIGLEQEALLNEWLKEEEDLLSPKAVASYSKKLIEAARRAYDEELRQEDPRAYAYRLHRMKGLPDEEFLKPGISALPEKEALENSIDLQRKFYTRSLIKKGLDEEAVDMLVKSAVDKGRLKDAAIAAYEADKADDERALANFQRDMEQRQLELQQNYNKVLQVLDTTIAKGDSFSVNIPGAEQTAFGDFVKRHVVHNEVDNNFYISIPLGTDNVSQVLQGLYLTYNKGDISKLRPKAQAKPAVRLGQKAPVIVPPAQDPPAPSNGAQSKTIKDIWNLG